MGGSGKEGDGKPKVVRGWGGGNRAQGTRDVKPYFPCHPHSAPISVFRGESAGLQVRLMSRFNPIARSSSKRLGLSAVVLTFHASENGTVHACMHYLPHCTFLLDGQIHRFNTQTLIVPIVMTAPRASVIATPPGAVSTISRLSSGFFFCKHQESKGRRTRRDGI